MGALWLAPDVLTDFGAGLGWRSSSKDEGVLPVIVYVGSGGGGGVYLLSVGVSTTRMAFGLAGPHRGRCYRLDGESWPHLGDGSGGESLGGPSRPFLVMPNPDCLPATQCAWQS